jgi:hypothetical protein
MYFIVKTILTALIIVTVSEVSKRNPGTGALIASLPLVSVLGVIWLWHDTRDVERIASHVGATFWYVLSSLPMFLLIPAMLRYGVPFWVSLIAGCALTIGLYLVMMGLTPRFGLKL